MLRILILPKRLNILRFAIHPARPRDFWRGALCCQVTILKAIIASVPVVNVASNNIIRRSFRSIDPNTDFCRIALNLYLIAAIADVVVGVLSPVVRGIVIVQFQGVFAEANLSAFRCCSRFQIAATILIHGSIRPEIIGIAVGAENVCSRNFAVPVAREAVGRRELRRRRIVGIRAAGRDRDR